MRSDRPMSNVQRPMSGYPTLPRITNHHDVRCDIGHWTLDIGHQTLDFGLSTLDFLRYPRDP